MGNLKLDKWEVSEFSGYTRYSSCREYAVARIISIPNLYYVDPNTEEEITYVGTIFEKRKNSKIKKIPTCRIIERDKNILKFKIDLKLTSMGYIIDKLGV